jgi:hypothetical protein
MLEAGAPVLPWRRRRWLCRLGLHRFAWAWPETLVGNYMRCELCGVEDGGNG